jgi:hypothetical protein
MFQSPFFPKPLINPDSIRASSSKSDFMMRWLGDSIRLRRLANSSSGTHSCTEPLAIMNVGGDGKGCSVQLIGQEIISAREGLRELADSVGEIDRLLVDDEFLKEEGHLGRK